MSGTSGNGGLLNKSAGDHVHLWQCLPGRKTADKCSHLSSSYPQAIRNRNSRSWQGREPRPESLAAQGPREPLLGCLDPAPAARRAKSGERLGGAPPEVSHQAPALHASQPLNLFSLSPWQYPTLARGPGQHFLTVKSE